MILSPSEAIIKAKIEAIGIPLKEWDVNIYRGILTGYNEAFIIDEETKTRLIEASPKNAEIIRPILLGKNIKAFKFEWENLYLINSHNGIKAKNIPAINLERDYPYLFSYISQFKTQLEKRLDKGDHWSNLRNCAYQEDFGKVKIAWGNLALKSQFCKIPSNFMINAPSPFFATEDMYLLAVLNSKLGDYYIKQLGVARCGGYIEFKPMFVEKLPIPKLNVDEKTKFVEIVSEILNNTDNTQHLEDMLNILVYNLYGITKEEIAIIESVS